MKTFNLELAKQGHPVCTRDGIPARIICFDRDIDNFPIVALVKKEGNTEHIQSYTSNGKYNLSEKESGFDLFMVGEKKTGWINIYLGFDGRYSPSNTIYDNEHEADEAAFGNTCKVDTIQIEFEA